MKTYAYHLVFLRLCCWALLALGLGLTLEAGAAPGDVYFRLRVPCPPHPTQTITFRCIRSLQQDWLSGVSTFNLQVACPPANAPAAATFYPYDSGWQNGNLEDSGGIFWFRWQKINPDNLQFENYGPVLNGGGAINTVDGDVQETMWFYGPSCLDDLLGQTNPDIPVEITNINPYGGTLSPTINGTNIPPPVGWTGPWPPWLAPGESAEVPLTSTNFASLGITNINQINWTFTPGPKPVQTTINYSTNVVSYQTNVNGGTQTVYVTNVVATVGNYSGIPTGTNSDGILQLESLEVLRRIETNTAILASGTNSFTVTNSFGTNGYHMEDSEAEAIISAQAAVGLPYAQAYTNLINVPVYGGGVSLDSASIPLITFPNGAGGYMQFSFDASEVLPSFEKVRDLLEWALLITMTLLNWKVLEDNIRHVQNGRQAQTAGNTVAGTNILKSFFAALVAVAIVGVWSAATGYIMGLSSFAIFNQNPSSFVSSFDYMGWLSNYVPIAEMFTVLFSYISFRVAAFKIASSAVLLQRFIVGL